MSREGFYTPSSELVSGLIVDAGLLHPTDSLEGVGGSAGAAGSLGNGPGAGGGSGSATGGGSGGGSHQHRAAAHSTLHAQTLGLGHALTGMMGAGGHMGGGAGNHHHPAGGGGGASAVGTQARAPASAHSTQGGGYAVAGLGALMGGEIKPMVEFEEPPPLSAYSLGSNVGLGSGPATGPPGRVLGGAPVNTVMGMPPAGLSVATAMGGAPGGQHRSIPGRLNPGTSRRRNGGDVGCEGNDVYWGGTLNAAVSKAEATGGGTALHGNGSYAARSLASQVVLQTQEAQQKQHREYLETMKQATDAANAAAGADALLSSDSDPKGGNETKDEESIIKPQAVMTQSSRASALPPSSTGLPLPPPPPIPSGGKSLLNLLSSSDGGDGSTAGILRPRGGGKNSSNGANGSSSSPANNAAGLLVSSAGDALYFQGHWNELGLPLPVE